MLTKATYPSTPEAFRLGLQELNRTAKLNQTEVKIIKPLCVDSEPNYSAQKVLEPNCN